MGLAHLGTLKVLETHAVELRGVAGTSAGAIVAGLACVGYTSTELYDPELNDKGGSPLLARLKVESAIHLLGPRNWWKIALLRSLWAPKDAGRLRKASSFAGGLGLSLGLHLWLLLAWLFLRRSRPGLCSMGPFIECYNQALREKLNEQARQRGAAELGPKHKVTFGDVLERTDRTLKVVSTCIDRRELALFGSRETPGIPVAEAVAASASIPIVFEPVQVPGYDWEEQRHHDGGLVSNLPAWTFDHDRQYDSAADTIVSQIVSRTGSNPVRPRGFGWLGSVARSAIFGANALNMRAIDRLYRFTIPVRIGLLDFDISKEKASQEVREYNKYAEARVGYEFIEVPDSLNTLCSDLRDLFQDALVQELPIAHLTAGSGVATGPVVRVALLEPVHERLGRGPHDSSAVRMLQIRYSAGFDDSPDQGLAIPVAGSLAGRAWRSRRIEREPAAGTSPTELLGEHNRLRRARLWRDVTWRIAVPVFVWPHAEQASPNMLLCIDGNHAPDYVMGVIDDAILETASRQIATVLGRIASRVTEFDRQVESDAL